MISLKAFGEHLAPLLGVTPNALYERQRALVRLGELPEPAKGRGLGLAATPSTVANLVVSVMATDNLSDTDVRVHRLAKARAKSRCKLTGKTHFVDAVSAVFSSPDLAAKATYIRVFRSTLAGQIAFYAQPPGASVSLPHETTEFGRLPDFPDRMEVEACLWGTVIEKITQLLSERGMQHE